MRIGEARCRLGAQIHHEKIRIAALLQAHDHALTVRRKSRREAHAGKVADDFALAGFNIVEKDARIALAVGHIGDLLRRRREPRGEDKLIAAGEIAHIGAVLIHDR